ncbi:MAG: fructose-6-phosphate aldolase [Candidatus Methanomethylophilaceae archaeon]|jgi:transaldolase|nr:fructose-6-phosphate aldolase [Methanomassiliicoccales archaeon RumEn M2]MDD2531938.1 fructose-6-phosphate aldolase [Candidatus Methanomethylophilaceae archaeon]MDI9378735.1 fructose-6-phosphate aldolase [Candidatus Thermoplasmatota archaeon]MDD2778980.1 fructose-6-phosphate aldolase [Candidatus Methanomethylophilaceae archaeon]MDD3127873.1 fructose-6-phosphate aldolase [Candidatus Methanomethylophilaceae archaeon]
MKIFIDTANIERIKEINSWGILDGVTTNPSLVAKEGMDLRTCVKQISEIVDGPISAEAMSMKAEDMVKEGRELAAIHENINVKLPMCIESLKATKKLSEEGIKVNMTLIFSSQQALLAAKAGAAFVSPFVGRLDDIGQDGTDLLVQIMDVFENYDFDTEVIAASIRHPIHVYAAAAIGCDIATIPYDILTKMVSHPKTDEGIAKFIEDYKKSKK